MNSCQRDPLALTQCAPEAFTISMCTRSVLCACLLWLRIACRWAQRSTAHQLWRGTQSLELGWCIWAPTLKAGEIATYRSRTEAWFWQAGQETNTRARLAALVQIPVVHVQLCRPQTSVGPTLFGALGPQSQSLGPLPDRRAVAPTCCGNNNTYSLLCSSTGLVACALGRQSHA